MRCPACHSVLTHFKVGSVALDGCQDGCGGIWFDHGELEQVNEEHPHADSEALTTLPPAPPQPVHDHGKRICPRCKIKTVMKQRLYSLGSGVVMDCCPKCEGVWLDHGELDKIRETFPKKPAATSVKVIHQIQILHHGGRAKK